MFTSIFRIQLSSLIVFCVVLSISHADQWEGEDKITRLLSQTHHWGQVGESDPNKGWSLYGYLKFDLGDSEYVVMQQNEGELVASVHSISDNSLSFRALSIPRVGIFYFPKKKFTCLPDDIEQIGLYGEMILYQLSKFYPNGPADRNMEKAKKVEIPATELRFMGGIMRLKNPKLHKSTVDVIGDGHYRFKLLQEGFEVPANVEWQKNVGHNVISDPESTENWLLCFSNQILFPEKKFGSLKTFKDIRKLKDDL